jgi:8-oxo-dGTP diphosphatase
VVTRLSLMNTVTNVQQRPSVSVDSIMTMKTSVLLVKRKHKAFQGYWALPGGLVNYGEKVEDAVRREMLEETSLHIYPTDILGVYSAPGRDPRGHVVTIVFVSAIIDGEPKPGEDCLDLRWTPFDEVQDGFLAFDHRKILADYLAWKQLPTTFWSSKKTI